MKKPRVNFYNLDGLGMLSVLNNRSSKQCIKLHFVDGSGLDLDADMFLDRNSKGELIFYSENCNIAFLNLKVSNYLMLETFKHPRLGDLVALRVRGLRSISITCQDANVFKELYSSYVVRTAQERHEQFMSEEKREIIHPMFSKKAIEKYISNFSLWEILNELEIVCTDLDSYLDCFGPRPADKIKVMSIFENVDLENTSFLMKDTTQGEMLCMAGLNIHLFHILDMFGLMANYLEFLTLSMFKPDMDKNFFHWYRKEIRN